MNHKDNTTPQDLSNFKHIQYFNRRQFICLSSLSTLGLFAGSLALPDIASANNEATKLVITEKYHIFVPYKIARYGGKQVVNLRTGDNIHVDIPQDLGDNHQIEVDGVGLEQNRIYITCHTLYDTGSFGTKAIETIEAGSFLLGETTKDKCKQVYHALEEGEYIESIADLEFLDSVIESSSLDDLIKRRYSIASENSRLLGIENILNKAESSSKDPKLLKATYQFVRAGEPVPNFKALTKLDALVQGSTLPNGIKQYYAFASARSRAVTVDVSIIKFIKNELSASEDIQQKYLETYQFIRDGKPVKDTVILKDLTKRIQESKLLENVKVIYSLAVNRFFDTTGDDPIFKAIEDSSELAEIDKNIYLGNYQQLRLTQNVEIAQEVTQDSLILLDEFINKAKIPESYQIVYQIIRSQFISEHPELMERNWLHQQTRQQVVNLGSNIIPIATQGLSVIGAEAGTGVAISTLSGGAAINATLAFLGGGSVASGGLGMLGGLAVATGGSALIGAAGLLSIALVSQLDGEDLRNLGVSSAIGTLASTAAVFVVWTGANALGVASGLSGAAATTVTMSALGGVSAFTGGAALIAFGVGSVMWSLFKGSRDRTIFNKLESRMYTLVDRPDPDSLASYIQTHLQTYGSNDILLSPNIQPEKLVNALDKFAKIEPDEKILAIIDTSLWDDSKEGIALTNRGIVAKHIWGNYEYIKYTDLDNSSISKLVYWIYEEDVYSDQLANDLKGIRDRANA